MSSKKLVRLALGGFMAGLAVFESHSILSTKVSNNVSRASSLQNPHRDGWKSTLHSFCKNYLKFLDVHADSNKADIRPWDWNWDNRHSPSTSKCAYGDSTDSSRRPVRHLLFIRHGKYHYAQDDANCHLTDLGKEQLTFTGKRLRHLNLNFKTLYYSTMTRAIESADEILQYIDVPAQPSDALREGAPYPLEPPLSYYKPSKEVLEEDGKRIESAFRQYVHRAESDQTEDTYEIFVCHANVIRYIVCRALQFPPEAWIRFSLDHGSITWIVVHGDGRVNLRWLGNSGHMPSDKITIN